MTPHRSDIAHADLVKVAHAHDAVGAEFLQALLDDAAIASVVRWPPGFDEPDRLAVGPRDVLVPAADADMALEVLRMEDPAAVPRSSRVFAALLIALALAAAVLCVVADVLV
jgi:hypothetical protein